MERSLLFLSYLFPPRAGAGVQRALKFVKYLPEMGWRPLVVANGGLEGDHVIRREDPTLLRDLGDDAIIRYTTLTPTERTRIRRTLTWRQRLSASDPTGWWVAPAIRTSLELLRQHRPSAIFVTMSPYSAARAGIRLKRLTGLPLVLDLRDPWAVDETRIYPTRWHAWRDSAAMRRALAAADLVIMNTPEAAAAAKLVLPREYAEAGQGGQHAGACASSLCSSPSPSPGTPGEGWGGGSRSKGVLTQQRIVVLTNGYDADDFTHCSHPVDPAPPDVLRIVHTGMFHSELARIWDDLHSRSGLRNRLKYARRPINLWTRTPRYLLEAIARAVAAGKIPPGKLELALVGQLSGGDQALIESSPARPMVRALGYRSHAESVGWLLSADTLFLPLHTPLDGGRALIVPGKAYEYLGSRRPILAMGPPGDMRDLVRSLAAGVAVEGDDVAGAAAALAQLYEAKVRGERPFAADPARIAAYERRELTRRLAAELDALVNPAPAFVPKQDSHAASNVAPAGLA